mgnify:CR=1 FL=1
MNSLSLGDIGNKDLSDITQEDWSKYYASTPENLDVSGLKNLSSADLARFEASKAFAESGQAFPAGLHRRWA